VTLIMVVPVVAHCAQRSVGLNVMLIIVAKLMIVVRVVAHSAQRSSLCTQKWYACRDPNLRIGRYTMEERRARILRYRQKRHHRNFNQKIKYVISLYSHLISLYSHTSSHCITRHLIVFTHVSLHSHMISLYSHVSSHCIHT